jgi:hypothetical protein
MLKGLAALQELNVPEPPPEVPVVGLRDFQGASSEEAERRDREKLAAMEKARTLGTLVRHRNILTERIVWLYTQEPYATEELRKLAADTTKDPKLADHLVELVDHKIKHTNKAERPPAKEGDGQAVKNPEAGCSVERDKPDAR